jgi:hypothetical protein
VFTAKLIIGSNVLADNETRLAAAESNITALATTDAQNVKLTGAQDIYGQKQFWDPISFAGPINQHRIGPSDNFPLLRPFLTAVDYYGVMQVGNIINFSANNTANDVQLTATTTALTCNKAFNATNVSASGTLAVTGTSTFTGNATFNGATTTTKAIAATNVSASGTLAVTGTSTFTGNATFNGATTTTKAITANGNVTSTGNSVLTHAMTDNSRNHFFTFGAAGSNNNNAFIDFERTTAGASSNGIGLGFYGADGLLRVSKDETLVKNPLKVNSAMWAYNYQVMKSADTVACNSTDWSNIGNPIIYVPAWELARFKLFFCTARWTYNSDWGYYEFMASRYNNDLGVVCKTFTNMDRLDFRFVYDSDTGLYQFQVKYLSATIANFNNNTVFVKLWCLG